jgi:UDP-N-acetylmuramoyl-tripeptide--D-alanyl-D-alanine ligase
VIPLSIREIAQLCPGKLETAPGAAEVTGAQIDSRRIEPGDLFVAVRAGTEFTADALKRGAAAALVPDDAFAALAALGSAVRERASARVVGITGSVGKTSTKDILAALCAPHARTVAAEASYNAELGVPLTLCRLEADTEICILELAMRGFGQIEELCEMAKPEIGVITSIAPVHLEFVGSLDGVARAKAELLEALPDGAPAIVPADAPALEPFLDDRLDVIRFGPGGDVTLESFEPPRLVADVGGARVELEVNFAAAHQAANVLPALAAYRALGLPLAGVGRGAGEIAFSRLRGEEVELPGGGTLINDCWNANPVSMKAALFHLVTRAEGGRSVAVLGDMAELGPDADAYHREVGAAAQEAGVDLLVAIGPRARGYVEGAGDGTWAEAVAEGIRELESRLRPGDTVLVKGSRAMGMEAVAEALTSVKAAS